MSMQRDITGQRFGMYLAISPTGLRSRNRSVIWLCQCDCGTERNIAVDVLLEGRTRSCGCGRGKHVMAARGFKFGESLRTRVFQDYALKARKVGRKFTISFDEFLKISSMNCYYCGALPSNRVTGRGNNGEFIYQGMDRIDNTKGYEKDNIVPCCILCNRAKMAMPYDIFLEWLNRIAAHYQVLIRNKRVA